MVADTRRRPTCAMSFGWRRTLAVACDDDTTWLLAADGQITCAPGGPRHIGVNGLTVDTDARIGTADGNTIADGPLPSRGPTRVRSAVVRAGEILAVDGDGLVWRGAVGSHQWEPTTLTGVERVIGVASAAVALDGDGTLWTRSGTGPRDWDPISLDATIVDAVVHGIGQATGATIVVALDDDGRLWATGIPELTGTVAAARVGIDRIAHIALGADHYNSLATIDTSGVAAEWHVGADRAPRAIPLPVPADTLVGGDHRGIWVTDTDANLWVFRRFANRIVTTPTNVGEFGTDAFALTWDLACRADPDGASVTELVAAANRIS